MWCWWWMLWGQATTDMLNLVNDRSRSVKDEAWYNKETRILVEKFGAENRPRKSYRWGS